ncbi:MAG: hypothetical protein JRG74_11730, partial [Deltaproteobacteria bacterium]|nr:hypothetical protein [Deltaproteobacteria bacterium]
IIHNIRIKKNVYELSGNKVLTGPQDRRERLLSLRSGLKSCLGKWDRRKPCDDWKCMNNLTVDKVFNIIRDKI